MLKIPFGPEDLNNMIQARAYKLKDRVIIRTYRIATLVQSGKTVTITLTIPNNYIDTRSKPLIIESTSYSKDISVDIKCDETPINPSPITLTNYIEVDFGGNYIKRSSIEIVVTNGSGSDVYITYQITTFLISQEIFKELYEPIIEYAWNKLEEIAK